MSRSAAKGDGAKPVTPQLQPVPDSVVTTKPGPSTTAASVVADVAAQDTAQARLPVDLAPGRARQFFLGLGDSASRGNRRDPAQVKDEDLDRNGVSHVFEKDQKTGQLKTGQLKVAEK